MGTILDSAIIPALQRLNLSYLEEPQQRGIAVPMPPPGERSGMLLIQVQPHDEDDAALVQAPLCQAPAARRAAVALLLAQINTRYSFVTFSMTAEGLVLVDICVEFTGLDESEREAPMTRALLRLLHALRECYAQIVQEAQPKHRRRPRVEREVDAVLRRLEG